MGCPDECWDVETLRRVVRNVPSGDVGQCCSSGKPRRCSVPGSPFVRTFKQGCFLSKMSQSRRATWMTFLSLASIGPYSEKTSELLLSVFVSGGRGCSNALPGARWAMSLFWKLPKKRRQNLRVKTTESIWNLDTMGEKKRWKEVDRFSLGEERIKEEHGNSLVVESW